MITLHLLKFKNNTKISKFYYQFITKLIYKNKIKYENTILLDKNKDKGFIIISNHTDFNDYLLIKNKINKCNIVAYLPCLYQKNNKIINKIQSIILDNLNIILYSRNTDSGVACKNKILDCIKKNEQVLVYPEGNFSKKNQNLEPFKKGLFYMAFENNIPMLLTTYVTDKHYGCNKSNFFNNFYNENKIKVKFNQFLYPKDYDDFDSFYNDAYRLMNEYYLH